MSDTIVFAYDTAEERQVVMDYINPLFLKEDGLRVVAISVDNELTRTQLIEEALERIDDPSDLRSTIADILDCPDLSKWSWDD